jgi:hypothetical protein
MTGRGMLDNVRMNEQTFSHLPTPQLLCKKAITFSYGRRWQHRVGNAGEHQSVISKVNKPQKAFLNRIR